jgi:glutamine synthetase
MNQPDAALEAREFLARHPDLRFVQAMFCDLNGVLRGKSVRPADLPGLFSDGLPLPASIAALQLNGDDAEDSGLLWEVGDMDCLAVPVAGTLVRSPWLHNGRALGRICHRYPA